MNAPIKRKTDAASFADKLQNYLLDHLEAKWGTSTEFYLKRPGGSIGQVWGKKLDASPGKPLPGKQKKATTTLLGWCLLTVRDLGVHEMPVKDETAEGEPDTYSCRQQNSVFVTLIDHAAKKAFSEVTPPSAWQQHAIMAHNESEHRARFPEADLEFDALTTLLGTYQESKDPTHARVVALAFESETISDLDKIAFLNILSEEERRGIFPPEYIGGLVAQLRESEQDPEDSKLGKMVKLIVAGEAL
jgi:hypothetical protein